MVRLRQALILLAGLVVAGVMVLLGIWQLDVYRAQGEAQAARRASLPPVEGDDATASASIACSRGVASAASCSVGWKSTKLR